MLTYYPIRQLDTLRRLVAAVQKEEYKYPNYYINDRYIQAIV